MGVERRHEILLHANTLLQWHIGSLHYDVHKHLQLGNLGACRGWAHHGEAKVQSASLPWQMREWAFLLLLVEGSEELQVYLSVLRQQVAILQPQFWGDLAYRYNHLDGQRTCRESPKDRHQIV